LISFHPGVEISHIQSRTGFELEISSDVGPTPAPTSQEIHLLREKIDPLGIRRLESLSGASRRKLLHEIIALESGFQRP
jgi:glutaconate CoA-transferase subunit A